MQHGQRERKHHGHRAKMPARVWGDVLEPSPIEELDRDTMAAMESLVQSSKTFARGTNSTSRASVLACKEALTRTATVQSRSSMTSSRPRRLAQTERKAS